jgi:hypothetical protein
MGTRASGNRLCGCASNTDWDQQSDNVGSGRIFRGWDSVPFDGHKKDTIRDDGACSRQECDKPKLTSQTVIKGVRTCRICSKNYFNGWGVWKNQVFNAKHRVQHDSSKGTCERGGANNTDGKGKDSRAFGDTTLQSHTKENEDWFHIFCDSMVECVSGEIRDITDHLATGTADALAFGLQETLSSATRNLLWSAQWTDAYKHHGVARPWGHSIGTNGQLAGKHKVYCINTGQVLKRCSFTPMPMPDRVIKQVYRIGEQEGQGQTFRFLNWQRQAYEWTDEVPEDDDDFQGLLEDKVEANPYPNISAELPGVELKEEEREFQMILDKPEPDFWDMAVAALHNAGIDGNKKIRAGRTWALAAAQAVQQGAALVEADENELV